MKLNLLGKKETFKTFLLYFISFSVIYSFPSVSLKVGRIERFFSKIFPCFLTFRCLLRNLLHICRLYLNSLDKAVQLMIIKVGKALIPLFPPSCSSLGKGDGSQTPDQNSANFSPIPIFITYTWNYFVSIGKTLSLKRFQIVPANIKSVTSKQAVFTYSHLN